MSNNTKSYLNDLLNQLLSNEDSLVYEALRKLDKVSNLFDHISESKLLASLQGVPRKWGTNDAIVKLATSLLKKLVSNNSSLNHSLCATSKTNVSNLPFNQCSTFEIQRSFTQSEKNRHAYHNTFSERSLSEQKHNFKSTRVYKDVKAVETLHESSIEKRPKSHSSNTASKMSPPHGIADFQQLCEDPTGFASKQKANPFKKEAPDFHKKGLYKTVFSESAHNVSKYTLSHNEKICYNLISNTIGESRKNCVGNKKDELTQVSCWPDSNTEVNGVSDEIHSKHPYKYSSTQKMNGHNYLNNNQSRSSESSHFHSKKHSRELDFDRSSFHYKRKTSHVDSNSSKSYTTIKPDFRSPDKFNSHNSSPTKKNIHHPSSSQKQNSNFRSPCRPDFPLPNHEDDSNKESFLSDESKHLMIDTAENCGDTSLDNNSKMTSPYSVQLKEGMFRTVKIGPEQEVLRVREVKHFGNGGLETGAFSWGWSIEKRGPSSSSSQSCKEKIPSAIPKDANRCKRKIDYEKSNATNVTKKHQPTRDVQKCKQRDSTSVKGRDIKSNSKEHLNVSSEDKDLKSNSGDDECNHNEYLNNSNEDKFLKKSITNNEDYRNKQKEHSYVSSEDKNFKESFSLKKMPSSPLTKNKTSNYVPASDGNKPIPKVDCDQKCSKVIDDTTMNFMSSKKDRRSIYSGRKVAHEIPPLKILCTEYLKKNILSVRINKSIPYEKLQPVLELCNPTTLRKLEEQNKHLCKYTDKLWEKLCKVRFRDELNTEKDLWKNIYLNALRKREDKLKSLAASISNGKTKALPERQAQWMGVDSQDPEKRRKKTRDETPPPPKIEMNGKVTAPSFGQKLQESESPTSPKMNQKPQKNLKPTKKVAPLMSKTKKMLNMVNRRR